MLEVLFVAGKNRIRLRLLAFADARKYVTREPNPRESCLMLRYLISGLLISILALLVSCGGGGGGNGVGEGSGSVQPSPGNSTGSGVANPSAGCSANTGLLTDSGTYTFQFNNIERTYRVYVPELMRRLWPARS